MAPPGPLRGRGTGGPACVDRGLRAGRGLSGGSEYPGSQLCGELPARRREPDRSCNQNPGKSPRATLEILEGVWLCEGECRVLAMFGGMGLSKGVVSVGVAWRV